ncbi:MAG: hypothetical protein ABIK65_09130 [Candidatus Eisenbacteria bacterium]
MKRFLPPFTLFTIIFAAPAAAFEAGLLPLGSYSASGYAMGNAVVALPARESNVWTNPAGLAYQEGYLFYAAPHDEVTGVTDDWRERVFAANGLRGLGGVFGAALVLRQQQNAAVGDPIVPADIDEPTLLVGYGRRIGAKYAVGATVLGYRHRSDLDTLDGDITGGVTLGMLRVWDHVHRNDLPLQWRWALALQNFGPSFDVGTTKTDLPLALRSGLSTRWEKEPGTSIVFSGDMHWLPREEGNENPRIGGGVGGELKLSGVVAVRLGYLWDADSERADVTYGFGIGNEVYGNIGGMLEYAHAPGPVDFADHIGLKVYWIP